MSASDRGRDRAQAKAARRADRDGSGPTLEERPPARHPGATAKFALLGEVLMVGLLVTLVSVPLVTLPAALAAGVRHLRRFAHAEGSPLSLFWRDVRDALLGGIGVGAAALGLVIVFLIDIDLAASGMLPGGPVVAVFGWLGLAVVGTALLAAAGLWSPQTRWRGALRGLPATVRADVPGALYLTATAGFTVVVTWALLPLIIPALGCAALAVMAVPERPRRRDA